MTWVTIMEHEEMVHPEAGAYRLQCALVDTALLLANGELGAALAAGERLRVTLHVPALGVLRVEVEREAPDEQHAL